MVFSKTSIGHTVYVGDSDTKYEQNEKQNTIKERQRLLFDFMHTLRGSNPVNLRFPLI